MGIGFFFKCVFLTIPFYLLWNWLAPIYFTQLPPLYLDIPYFHALGFFILVGTIRSLIIPSPSILTKIKWKAANRFKDYIDVN